MPRYTFQLSVFGWQLLVAGSPKGTKALKDSADRTIKSKGA
jgi:hypothetical protein